MLDDTMLTPVSFAIPKDRTMAQEPIDHHIFYIARLRSTIGQMTLDTRARVDARWEPR
jgi:hypothetical protein